MVGAGRDSQRHTRFCDAFNDEEGMINEGDGFERDEELNIKAEAAERSEAELFIADRVD